jgi:hypothetical protein
LELHPEKGILFTSMDIILHKHKLKHISELRIDSSIFTKKYPSACSMNNCTGECCKWGVFADVTERDNILNHTQMIQRYLEPTQEKNPDKWFESDTCEDIDFQSGLAIGTQATEHGCVFLDSNGLCALQKAALAQGLHPFALKPFYCIAFPLVISQHSLMIDDLEIENRPNCCSHLDNGTKSILDLCATELEFMLGREGFEEFKNIFDQQNR